MLEHSPLGASGMERWANCRGSATLVELLRKSVKGTLHEDSPDFQRDGVQAHKLAETCLRLNVDTFEAPEGEYPLLTAEMMAAVQVHLNYVRSKNGWKFVELKMHRPEFHDLTYGTTDVAVLDPKALEIIDYKHGIGIVVEVEGNLQILYYAFMVIDELGEAWSDDTPITLTIVQPRAPWHPDGVIRSWIVTVGFVRKWAVEVLRPAMEVAYLDGSLVTGEHCRFCPAKLLCPGFLSVARRAQTLDLATLTAMNADLLAELLKDVKVIRMAAAALEKEAAHRVVTKREMIPGWKAVRAISHRVWKPNAEFALKEEYGHDRWQPIKLKSPAEVEAMENGKKIVAEFAYAPDNGFDVVPVSDRRKEVKIEGAEKWDNFVKNMKEKS